MDKNVFIKKSDKCALLFPGIGYTHQKPLMYYGRQLAAGGGYDCFPVTYGGFPDNVKGSPEKMREALFGALEQVRASLQGFPFEDYRELLFISKSIGTAVACIYQREIGRTGKNVYFTPVAETFSCIVAGGIVFHGTMDPWVRTDLVERRCREEGLPLYTFEGANHSLETGDAMKNIRILTETMETVRAYIGES